MGWFNNQQMWTDAIEHKTGSKTGDCNRNRTMLWKHRKSQKQLLHLQLEWLALGRMQRKQTDAVKATTATETAWACGRGQRHECCDPSARYLGIGQDPHPGLAAYNDPPKPSALPEFRCLLTNPMQHAYVFRCYNPQQEQGNHFAPDRPGLRRKH